MTRGPWPGARRSLPGGFRASSPTRSHAFTLIELLIVVAIIAILAAIALPNLLEAQTRAKVSRAKADMRSVATALEAYRIDLNTYPPTRGSDAETEPVHRFNGYGEVCYGAFQTISLRLSTPVSYITSASVADPFKRGGSEPNGRAYDSGNPADLALGYHNVHQLAIVEMTPGWYPDDFTTDYGFWRLFSVGPARTSYDFGNADLGWFYDPTNGTLSEGYIVRTQFDPEGRRLAIPDP